jgi:hypothetical protein
MTRVATFLLLLASGVVAGLFAVRFISVAAGWDFSPFTYITPSSAHSLLAWLLVIAMAVLAGLIWLVLRHDADALWLASSAGDGGVLLPKADLERLVAGAVRRAHPDVVRAEADVWQRGGEVRCRVKVWARPLAAADGVRAAVEEGARRQVARLTQSELGRADVRVHVLRVGQLVRYLP